MIGNTNAIKRSEKYSAFYSHQVHEICWSLRKHITFLWKCMTLDSYMYTNIAISDEAPFGGGWQWQI